MLTTSRADFAHLRWPLREMVQHPDLEPVLIVSGAHLSDEFGHSAHEIEAAGFRIDHRVECLLSSDTDVGMAKTIGVATLGLADLLGRLRPDLMLLIADRYEMLAPAAVALALRIPIAHIEGGEVSEGAIDDAVRNALTKIAHLHFTPTTQARDRVLAMGEEAWRVHAVGAPSVDTLLRERLLARDALAATLGVQLQTHFLLVSLHPLTLAADTLTELGPVFEALEQIDEQILFCFPNADAGSRELVRHARAFCARRESDHVFVNLAPLVYWSLLAQSDMLLGNSSSGIMETPSLRIPSVNIGERQHGRERAANILDAPANADTILACVARARSQEFRASIETLSSPYGDGHAGERIAETLATAPGRETLLRKRALPVRRTGTGCAFVAYDAERT